MPAKKTNRKAECHPEEKHFALGRCKKCYHSFASRRDRTRTNANARNWAAKNRDKILAIGRKYRYGVTAAEVEARKEEQNYLCAICECGSAEHVDHDHGTGTFRGMLCGHCNRGLGLFRDNANRLLRAIAYLKGQRMNGRGGKGMIEQPKATIVAPAATPERAHAILSASGAKIWLTCTPAGRFQEEFEDKETDFSREGTWAHSVAAHRLAVFLGEKTEFADEKQIPGWTEFWNQASDEAINAYVRRCIIAISAARQETPDAVVLLEQRLDFSDWVPEGFGTGDLVIVANKRCTVRDLKFGKGVRVDAEDNEQLYMYALGAIAAYRGIYDFDEIVVEIDQPRLNHVDGGDNVLKVEDLVDWANKYVAPRAALAWEGKGDFAAGDHCRFCRARNACAARADSLKVAVDACFDAEEQDQVDAATSKDKKPAYARLTDERLIELYPKLDQLIKWATGLKEHVQETAVKGKVWAGYKLVAGRSNRVITDPAGLAEVLMMEGVNEAMIYEPPKPREIVGLGELEKLVGKKKFGELSVGFIEKPDGKPTLVPESDKREAIKKITADEAFE